MLAGLLALLPACGAGRRDALQPRTHDLASLRAEAARHPESAAPHVQMALVHRQRGEHDQALASLRQALGREPLHVAALTLSAQIFYECGRSAEGLQFFASRPLSEWPEPVRCDIALLLADVGETDGARQVLESLRATSVGAAASANLAWLDLLAGDNAAAATQLENAQAPEARNNLAVALLRQGEVERSESLLRDLVAAHPEFEPARTNLALLLLHWHGDAAAADAVAHAAQEPRLSDVAVHQFLNDLVEDTTSPPPNAGGPDGAQN
ncbi:MAG TPA: tetratricopeptide repeat protein [Candidatus Krumholzibacteria bacterium]|nr:tetratricopeptide repeat protein [Candidatus Krumholzibacteria bacterium]